VKHRRIDQPGGSLANPTRELLLAQPADQNDSKPCFNSQEVNRQARLQCKASTESFASLLTVTFFAKWQGGV
jgi:hypothetical protein